MRSWCRGTPFAERTCHGVLAMTVTVKARVLASSSSKVRLAGSSGDADQGFSCGWCVWLDDEWYPALTFCL